MKKMMLFFFFIASISSARADQKSIKEQFAIYWTKIQEAIYEAYQTYNTIVEGDAINDDIDVLVSMTQLSSTEQQEMVKAKKEIIPAIISHLNDTGLEGQVREDQRKELTKAALIALIRERTNLHVQYQIHHMATQPPYNPETLNNVNIEALAEKLRIQIANEAEDALRASNKYGVLKKFVSGELKYRIDNEIEKAYGIDQSTAAPEPLYPLVDEHVHAPAPPAYVYNPPAYNPELQNYIYELYPQFTSDERNIDFHERREAGKIYREADCPVCDIEFIEMEKRVTLFCGHTICPSCLFEMLIIENNAKCPLCSKEIIKEEFAGHYLKPHVNVEKLKEEYPHKINEIQQHFR